MRTTRIVADLRVPDLATAKSFYTDYLGLSTEEFNLGWVARYTSPVTGANVQLVTRDAAAPEDPAVSVFTDDVDTKFKIKMDGRKTTVVRDKDPSRTVVARFTVQPGAQFPWHSHPGPVIVNVVQGELTYLPSSDCVERKYGAGTAFVDPGHGHTHTAWNATGGVTVFVATFFAAPATGPLLIPASQGCP